MHFQISAGFASSSGILSNIGPQYNQMTEEMTNFEKNFYGEYFDNFMRHKQGVFEETKKKAVKLIKGGTHRQSIIYLLESDIQGISVYRDFSWPEKIFHALYNILPQCVVDAMVVKVLNPENITWKGQSTNE